MKIFQASKIWANDSSHKITPRKLSIKRLKHMGNLFDISSALVKSTQKLEALVDYRQPND
jgi:hypothetical protein